MTTALIHVEMINVYFKIEFNDDMVDEFCIKVKNYEYYIDNDYKKADIVNYSKINLFFVECDKGFNTEIEFDLHCKILHKIHEKLREMDIFQNKKSTVRLIAHGAFVNQYDADIKKILSNKFTVCESAKIYGDTYEFEDEYKNIEVTDYAIFIMYEYPTDREPIQEWFDRMIYPVINYAKFTYIILRTHSHSHEYKGQPNFNIKYVCSYKSLYEEIIPILKELCI